MPAKVCWIVHITVTDPASFPQGGFIFTTTRSTVGTEVVADRM
jgi:hypothetical protein